VVEEPEPVEISEPEPEPEPVPEEPAIKEIPMEKPPEKPVEKKQQPKKEPVKKTRKPKRPQAPVVKTSQPKASEPTSQPKVSAVANPSVPSAAEKRAALERRVIRRLLALIEQERIYPYSARRMGLDGKAEIVVMVNPGGRISGFNVSSASHGVFERAAMTTMQRVAGRKEQLDAGLSDSIKVRVPLVFTIKE
jgi:protein TonB